MTPRIFILLFIIFIITATTGFSQDSTSRSPHKYSGGTIIVTFGGLREGEISINDHLTDSLAFTDPDLNDWWRIQCFHLTITCKGQVLKYLENNSGNKLTNEMKDAVKKFHPGCCLIFDGITLMAVHKDIFAETHPRFDFPGGPRLTLK